MRRYVLLMMMSGLIAPAQDTGAVVEGTVVNSATGAGINEAKVELSGRDRNHYDALTDSSGNFHITGVKPGDYSSRVEKPGFFMPLSPFLKGTAMHIVAGKDPEKLRLELTPPARLRGRVIGIDGMPAAKVQVATGNQYSQTATTNEDGDFVLIISSQAPTA